MHCFGLKPWEDDDVDEALQILKAFIAEDNNEWTDPMPRVCVYESYDRRRERTNKGYSAVPMICMEPRLPTSIKEPVFYIYICASDFRFNQATFFNHAHVSIL